MIRALALAAENVGAHRDQKSPSIVVRSRGYKNWYVAVERTDENDARVVVCKANETSCARALLACGLALLVVRQRTGRLDGWAKLASAVRKALFS